MGKKEKHVDEINALLAEEITPKRNTLRSERRAILQYQKASTELECLACVLCAYKWTNHDAEVARKEAQIAEQAREVDQACREKERATREVGVTEKNRVDVQMQRDREQKKGGKVTRMAEEAKELEKVVIKLHTQAEIEEGAIKDEEAAWGASARDLSEVRASLFSFVSRWLIYRPARNCTGGEKGAIKSCRGRVQSRYRKAHQYADCTRHYRRPPDTPCRSRQFPRAVFQRRWIHGPDCCPRTTGPGGC